MIKILKLFLLISFALYANAINQLTSQTCSKLTTEENCINSINDDVTDKTKCLPIIPVGK